jgi:hypothetical protein
VYLLKLLQQISGFPVVYSYYTDEGCNDVGFIAQTWRQPEGKERHCKTPPPSAAKQLQMQQQCGSWPKCRPYLHWHEITFFIR